MSGEDVIVSIGIDASAANEGLARSSVKFSGWSRDTERAIAKAEAARWAATLPTFGGQG